MKEREAKQNIYIYIYIYIYIKKELKEMRKLAKKMLHGLYVPICVCSIAAKERDEVKYKKKTN